MSRRPGTMGGAPQTPSLTTALVTAGVAVLVAVIGQIGARLLERYRQWYERRRASPIEMQDVALELRDLLVESGRSITDATAETDASGIVALREDEDLGCAVGSRRSASWRCACRGWRTS